MYCPNCASDVEVRNGYCTKCGTAVNTRLCPKGHVMDPSWTECKYCPPGSSAPSSGQGAPPGTKGRTLIESGSMGSPPPGGFVKGATLLEDSPKGAGMGGGVPGKGRTVVDPTLKKGNKGKTVFDPGVAAPGTQKKEVLPKLVGWLVSFSHDSSGVDYRIREGRNVIGADHGECDVAVTEDQSISTKHAFLMYRDGRFQLRDNDSTNGTYVNEQDIFGEGSVTLNDGDKIRFGGTECTLFVIDK